MKAFIKISKLAFLTTMVLSLGFTGCKETAELSVDPEVPVYSFTFAPAIGPSGTTVVIKGSGLSSVTAVAFGSVAAPIKAKSDTEITTEVPVGAITGNIKLVKNGVIITNGPAFEVTLTPVPTVNAYNPGSAGSKQEVVLTGTLFNKVDSVYIGELKADIKPGRTESQMTIVTPAGMQPGKIRLYYVGMTTYGMEKVFFSESETELGLNLPGIEQIEVSGQGNFSALNVGETITIRGAMLNELVKLEFGSVEVTEFAVNQDGTELSFVVPALTTIASAETGVSGVITLHVVDGSVSSSTFRLKLPRVTRFLPAKAGEIPEARRYFVVEGTNMNIVTGAKVGNAVAEIESMSETMVTFFVSSTVTGAITLQSANGNVVTGSPFFMVGDFWVIDFDREFTPKRYTHEGWDGVASSSSEVVAGTGDRGNYRRTTATISAGGSPRYYIRGDGANANPAPDRFLLYTNNSQGVYFEFDISYNSLPQSFFNENGEISIKVHMFATDQARGYGYSSMHKVKFDGPNTWKTVRVNTNLMGKETNSGGLFNDVIPPLSNRFEPNNCRIIGLIFTGGQSNEVAVGQVIDINLDNIKFVIE